MLEAEEAEVEGVDDRLEANFTTTVVLDALHEHNDTVETSLDLRNLHLLRVLKDVLGHKVLT